MSNKLIFLSHIHEESELAVLFKTEIETEFSGFVDVFVSSDGTSIPAGSNFLNRIENGLVNCLGAIYLISPSSVKRNWINFELGAIWIRNAISLKAHGPEIPALPICHSGMTPSNLPAPLNNLNAILANQSSQLEFAFKSLQTAMGGKGQLKTNFDNLAGEVINLEQKYTLASNLKKMFALLNGDIANLVMQCEQLDPTTNINLDCGFLETSIVHAIKHFEENELKGLFSVTVEFAGTTFGSLGATNGAHIKISIPVALILKFKNILLS